MNSSLQLKGITWNHSRGIVPLQAAAQRFTELHPGVEIIWEKRSLQEFADYPIEKLTEFYDLLIIDHPWVGTAAANKCVLPLDMYLNKDFMNQLAENSVGRSHESYNYNGSQWALAIDAASPVASYRKDLFEANNAAVPRTWEELISLAKKGKVAVPAIPIDLLMNFYTFCIACGSEPFTTKGEVIDAEIGLMALQAMKQLYSLVNKNMFVNNPIAVAELMSNCDNYWYCPFAYCYSNYSRQHYSRNILHYGGTVTFRGRELLTTLGGTGLAVPAFTKHRDAALDFVQLVCSPQNLATEYIYNGGQPGYDFGWDLALNNQLTNDFFANCRGVLDRSYVRPRYHGYLHFQDIAGNFIHEYLMNDNVSEKKVLGDLNNIYKESLKK